MKTEKELLKEIRSKYGSVSKMISIVDNEIHRLREYGGHKGRDSADTLEQAIRLIPAAYRPIFYRYHFTFPRP